MGELLNSTRDLKLQTMALHRVLLNFGLNSRLELQTSKLIRGVESLLLQEKGRVAK